MEAEDKGRGGGVAPSGLGTNDSAKCDRLGGITEGLGGGMEPAVAGLGGGVAPRVVGPLEVGPKVDAPGEVVCAREGARDGGGGSAAGVAAPLSPA